MRAVSLYSGECDGLGLSVVSWQAYPVFALVAEIDRMTGGNKP